MICVGHCEHWAVSMLGHLFLLNTKPDPLHWLRLSDFWGSTHRHTFYLLQRFISNSWMLLVSPSLNSPGLAHSHIRDGPDMMVYDTLQGKNLTFHSSRQPSWSYCDTQVREPTFLPESVVPKTEQLLSSIIQHVTAHNTRGCGQVKKCHSGGCGRRRRPPAPQTLLSLQASLVSFPTNSPKRNCHQHPEHPNQTFWILNMNQFSNDFIIIILCDV